MTDKINELKALIETLAEDSPLRKQLQDVLDAEMKRKAEEQKEEGADNETGKSEYTLDDLKKLDERLEEMLKEMGEEPTGIIGKLEELMDDDEFITASAGFVLGAMVTGLGALAFSALKKK